jgi:hypothetical protein
MTCALLPHIPCLAHLSVLGPTSQEKDPADPPPAFFLPHLRSFAGPRFLALRVVRSSALLAEVRIIDAISGSRALEVVEALHTCSVREIELLLSVWEPDVIPEITHRFSGCRRLEIAYGALGPDQVGFDLLDTRCF